MLLNTITRTAKIIAVISILPYLGLAKPDTNFSAKESDEIFEEILSSRIAVQPLGIVLANIYDFDKNDSRKARMEYDFGQRLQVIAIEKGSLGEKLGLLVGDVLMEFNGIYIPKGQNALNDLSEKIIPQIDVATPLSGLVIRNGYAHMLGEN